MYSFLVQPWTTMRVANAAPNTITQSEANWLDLFAFQDVVAWLEVRNFTLGGAATITMTYQTAPTKDDVLFAGMGTQTLAVGALAPLVMRMTGAGVPLSRFFRWQLGVTGAPTASWDATFRLWIAANVSSSKLARVSPATMARMPRGAPSKPCSGCSASSPTGQAGTLPVGMVAKPPQGPASFAGAPNMQNYQRASRPIN